MSPGELLLWAAVVLVAAFVGSAVVAGIVDGLRQHGRRCSWCARPLRWWQLEWCRQCTAALAANPSPPYPADSRRGAHRDRLLGRRHGRG